jgi:hypothetical protein
MLGRSTAILALALVATPAAAGPDSDMLRKLGMLGAWAVNCANPPSNANPHLEYIASESGYPTRKTIMDAKPSFAEMRNVRLIASDRIAFLDVRKPDGDRTNIVLAVMGQRWRSQDASDMDGKAYIKNGKFVSSGQDTLVFDKCSGGRTQ